MRKWFIFAAVLIVTFVFASLITDWKKISNMFSLDDFMDYDEAKVTSFTVPPYIELDLGFVITNHILAGIDTTIDYSVLTTDATLVAQYKSFRREVIKLMRNGVVITDDPEYGVYVWLKHNDEYILLNALLVKYGFAKARGGGFYEKEFTKLVEEAKAKELGLWKYKNPPTKTRLISSYISSGLRVVNNASNLFEVLSAEVYPAKDNNYYPYLLVVAVKNKTGKTVDPYFIIRSGNKVLFAGSKTIFGLRAFESRSFNFYLPEKPNYVEIVEKR